MKKIEQYIPEEKQAFLRKVKQIAHNLGTNYKWLLAVMWSESRLRPDVVNSIGCVGLIQFCPQTYKKWGLTAEQLRRMSAIEQLDYVYKYYKEWKEKGIKFKSPEALYLTTFYPVALLKGWHKNKNYIIGSERSYQWAKKIGQQNKAFDIDKDGYISIKDFRKYNRELLKNLEIKNNKWLYLLLFFLLLGVGVAFWQKEKLKIWISTLLTMKI